MSRSGQWRGEPSRVISDPKPGHFKMRLCSKGWHVPCAILRDDDGVWQVIIDGTPGPRNTDPSLAGVDDVWTSAARIDEWEYIGLLDLKQWAQRASQDHPCLHPRTPISPMRLRPIQPRS